MSVVDDMVPMLKKLRLSGVLTSLELRLREATDDKLSHEEFLYRVLCDEVQRRDAKQLNLRVRKASFEQHRSIEDFDFAFNPQLPKEKILSLATCTFIEEHRNVLLVGPTGVGKSHLAQALGQRACPAGHSVLYVAASDMLKPSGRLGPTTPTIASCFDSQRPLCSSSTTSASAPSRATSRWTSSRSSERATSVAAPSYHCSPVPPSTASSTEPRS